jgi:hypothetical protein
VLLRDGRHYECEAWITDGLVHARVVRRRIGDESHRELGDRTWPRSRLHEIRWLEADQELAA